MSEMSSGASGGPTTTPPSQPQQSDVSVRVVDLERGTGSDMHEMPPSRAAFHAFYVLATMTITATIMSWWLFFWGNAGAERFAALSLSPLLTIMATAAGYYFGSRPGNG